MTRSTIVGKIVATRRWPPSQEPTTPTRSARPRHVQALVVALLSLGAVLGPPRPVDAQPIAHTILVGYGTVEVAANPNTNTVYALSSSTNPCCWGNGTLAVIDGATNMVVANIPVGDLPAGIAVNSATNTIYIARQGGFLTVIDGATRTIVDNLPLHYNPTGLVAVNPATNHVYVGRDNGELDVIDGSTTTITGTISLGYQVYGIAVNPTTNTVYVAGDDGALTVIDGATSTITATSLVGWWTITVGVDPTSNLVYVPNVYDDFVDNDWETFICRVSVIDASTNTVTATIPLFFGTDSVGVDPVTHTVYISHADNEYKIAVIDGATNSVIADVPFAAYPRSMAVNSATHALYVSTGNGDVSVIDTTPGAPTATASSTTTQIVAQTAMPTQTPTATPTSVPPTATVTPSATPTPPASPTPTPSPTSTKTPTATATPTSTETPIPTLTPTTSPTATSTPSATATLPPNQLTVTFDERARDAMAGDVQYACPALAANQLLSRWAPSAFAHEFDDAGAGPLGAMHSAELAYFFNLNLGGPVMGPGSLPTTSQALARTMRGYWASFARSGIPSVSGAATWDPFPRQIQLLVAPSPGSESSVEYSSRHHGAFWQ